MIFITASDVAALTGFSDGAAFLQARPRLERDHDFPLPMPTCLRPLKWRKDAVTSWVDLQCRPTSDDPFVGGPNVVLLEEARRA
ncbi:hypothetical protein K3758_07620 [Sulfitobacter sp. W002]|uniref:hypothetical protein n=1 Tax=Sulfitobacter sp. W002 TaxID=2867024 RepID=UPI0021A93AE5|nr:hypothetical protein [Sulfitobacter sp. W002]UWR31363.1 hypothetical protein K3758_07620 [Sulfitobacter sp. W002]